MSKRHNAEEAATRDAGRYPITPHDGKKSVGTHVATPCEDDPTVASVDDESVSGGGGAPSSGGYSLS